MSNSGLEVLARMTDSKIKLRDMVDEWTLITYDIPMTLEGNKARARFLKAAAAIGAVRHTDSVYLIPNSAEANALALELAKTEGGEVIVWDKAQPLNHKEDVLAGYDKALKPHLQDISQRLDHMTGARQTHPKTFIRMMNKTDRMMDNMGAAIMRRGSEVLAIWFEILKERYHQIGGR